MQVQMLLEYQYNNIENKYMQFNGLLWNPKDETV